MAGENGCSRVGLACEWMEPDSAPPDVQDACAICLETLCDPTRLCCGHVFCRICAYRALQLGGSCPMCRDTATARPTLPADLLLDTETEQRLASRYSTAEMQARKAAMAATLPSPTGHGAEVVEEIPRGWIRKVSREGIPYYFNPHTRRTQYSPPSSSPPPSRGAQLDTGTVRHVVRVRVCGVAVRSPCSCCRGITPFGQCALCFFTLAIAIFIAIVGVRGGCGWHGYPCVLAQCGTTATTGGLNGDDGSSSVCACDSGWVGETCLFSRRSVRERALSAYAVVAAHVAQLTSPCGWLVNTRRAQITGSRMPKAIAGMRALQFTVAASLLPRHRLPGPSSRCDKDIADVVYFN